MNDRGTGAASDARRLRNALGSYPTGVTIVTCRRPDGATVGVTMNSFVSLSLAPPLVSVAVHCAARHLPAFLESGAFAINVLRADQRHLSSRFARPSECSWQGVPLSITPSGYVVLEGVVAWFLCRHRTRYAAGDHLLLVGEIEDFSYDLQAEPLAFWRGHYGSVCIAPDMLQWDPVEAWPWPAVGWG